ncbi:MAG: hypothetical protein KKI02_09965 [Planctomycetes bacterium]|nr:hypothetical protein [Planctomycetota bacterium]
MRKEPFLTQVASFVELFVWLLVLKSFFLPLFIIPTGSMAETLAGAHAAFTCPNCGFEYGVGFHTPTGPKIVQCPNCRQQLWTRQGKLDGIRLAAKAGDRIVVHGWPFDIGGRFGPRRWDVVVFKNPNEPDINFIKRLIGLPGETIEIIDGDVFVKGKDDAALHTARKTPHAQRALWFPYYNHDYPPSQSTRDWAVRSRQMRPRWHTYHPRWAPVGDPAGWEGLETRAPQFRGTELARHEMQFVTQPGENAPPGNVLDIYGYNSTGTEYQKVTEYKNVTDVRLSTTVELRSGDGYVELAISKHDHAFYARLRADGRLTLEHGHVNSSAREPWGATTVSLPSHPTRFALGHADYHVTVDIDGKTVLESSPGLYNITPETARELSRRNAPPTIRIAAERIDAALAHVLIERDVHYTSGRLRDHQTQAGTGTQGNAIALNDDAYFMCGDNSPGSHDSRAWSEVDLGPHLRAAYADGAYQLGTVPADQMIGRAFFVYWPGFLPLSAKGPNLLPDLGRVRWIH